MLRSLWISGAVTLITVLLAYPIAYYVSFHGGRHKALFEKITPADVRWVCQRLSALSDAQLHDAFRAGGYPRATADRFISRLRHKIAEGAQLKD